MLFKNIIAILEKCENANLNDVLVAEDMLANDRPDDIESIRIAGNYLHEYYHEITKCNRLGMTEKIKEICDANGDKQKLKVIFEELEKVEG